MKMKILTSTLFAIVFLYSTVFTDVSEAVTEGSREYTVNFKAVTFTKAISMCNKFGLELATPLNEQEENALKKVLLKQAQRNGISSVNAWIGGVRCSDCDRSGKEFLWLPKGDKQIYMNFNTGEPNNLRSDQNCLVQKYRKEGNITTWDGLRCNATASYICQSKSAAVQYSKLSKHSKQYIVGAETVTHYNATVLCHQLGMELAEPMNPDEELAIEQAWKEQVLTPKRLTGSIPAWLGGIRCPGCNSIWASTSKPIVYSKYQIGEPNNLEGIQNCLSIIYDFPVLTQEFGWNDRTCDEKYQFICQSRNC